MNSQESVFQSKLSINNSFASNIRNLLILIFPYATFMGANINIFRINISNLFSLILVFAVFSSGLKRRFNSASSPIIFFMMLIFYGVATLMWSKYSSIGFSIIFPLITGFIAMAFLISLNETELNLFLNSFTLFTLIVLIIAVFEIFTGQYLFFNNPDFIYRKNIYNLHFPGVSFTNPNDLAQFLIVGFPLLVFRRLENKKNIVLPAIYLLATIFVLANSFQGFR